MRVISGKFRGKKLLAPKDDAVRPTIDRVKESLFNILQFRIAGAHVLDLFAGSGALGIEAVSRGAAKVIFADENADLVKRNLKSLDCDCTVLQGDYSSVLDKLAFSGERFDVILLDPPYQSQTAENAMKKITAKKLLKDGGILVLEHSPEHKVSAEGLEEYDARTYGKVALSFYQPIAKGE